MSVSALFPQLLEPLHRWAQYVCYCCCFFGCICSSISHPILFHPSGALNTPPKQIINNSFTTKRFQTPKTKLKTTPTNSMFLVFLFSLMNKKNWQFFLHALHLGHQPKERKFIEGKNQIKTKPHSPFRLTQHFSFIKPPYILLNIFSFFIKSLISNLAIVPLCTSSGPSAKRRVRI